MNSWNAEDYHHNSSNQQRWAQDLITKIDFQGNERVLDIGCGDGKITTEIATYLPSGSVLGIDISQEMIGFAQKKFPMSNFPRVRFQTGDMTKLNFDNEFDIIVSFSCLHWILDHISVLEGIKRSLKPHGRAFLQFGAKLRNISPIRIAIKKVISNAQWSKYFEDSEGFVSRKGFYNPDEYKEMLTRVELKAQRIDLVPKDMIFQGKEEFRGFIRTTGNPDYLTKLPESLRETVVNEIVDTYLEEYPLNSAGLIYIPMLRLEVEATKANK